MKDKTDSRNLWAAAACIGILFSGQSFGATLVGTSSTNDLFPEPLTDEQIAVWEMTEFNFSSPSLAKCDDMDTGACVWGNGASGGDYTADPAFSVTFDDRTEDGFFPDGITPKYETKTGTWSFDSTKVTGIDPVLFPTYYVVKAGDAFAAYMLDATDCDASGCSSIAWDTSDVGDKGVSHISFYDTAVVPIPAAAWLFGSGLIALAGLKRRKR